jgi:hypothetical protein
MLRLMLVLMLPLAGCAVLEPDPLEVQAASLRSPEMEAAIRSARPGEPRP